MKINALMAVLAAVIALGTVGCAETPTNQVRYSMVQDLNPSALREDPRVVLELNPALNEGGVVLQSGSNGLVEAKFHRWAEPLDQQLLAITRACLDERKTRLGRQLLEVYVARFQGSPEGTVHVGAAFALVRGDRRVKSVDRSVELSQSKIGYPALVEELKAAYTKICQEALDELGL